MEQQFYFYIVLLLMGVAVLDLVVGVTNDAVNFLNSAIGSNVASRKVIFLIASVGLFAGVLFSSGMMEVARKGIFNPHFFTMPDLMTLFFAVMVADLVILDLFNTHALPTSTTVSIVFELLGAAVALSLIKIILAGGDISMLEQYINSSRALIIIGGILLSVVVAFIAGACIQCIGRLLFTFDYKSSMKRFGGFWGGLCLSAITLFILLKGVKDATFLTDEMSIVIKSNLFTIYLITLLLSGVIFHIATSRFNLNIFKPIVLLGTFSLALAFAANDLVNFVGVPIASYHAYAAAFDTVNPLTVPMDMLAGKVPSTTGILLICGLVMVLALWFSRKARGVTDTEIRLSSQQAVKERFASHPISQLIVRVFQQVFRLLGALSPALLKNFIRSRYEVLLEEGESDTSSFDLLRASTNLMVASVLISFATSLKLPLSTTYVTFMVAMGTSFADGAWEGETAVQRVTGVLTVIGGWFMTALMAFFTAGLFCAIIYFGGIYGGAGIMILAGFIFYKNHNLHKVRYEYLNFAQSVA